MRGLHERHKAFGRRTGAFVGATIAVVLFATTASAQQCRIPPGRKKARRVQGYRPRRDDRPERGRPVHR